MGTTISSLKLQRGYVLIVSDKCVKDNHGDLSVTTDASKNKTGNKIMSAC